MARDEQEEEREFLADLKARSGHDLAQWMAAITAQGFADKNETIDWLRAQGFPFARASWLERIHSNGGRPIYMDQPPKPAPRSPAAAAKPVPAARAPSRARGRRPREAAGGGQGLPAALPAAGGRDPAGRPGRRRHAEGRPTSRLPRRREFAAVTLHATELRLGLDLGDRPFDATLQRPRMKGPGPAISHMLVLTDARQVNADLLNLIKAANARVNG